MRQTSPLFLILVFAALPAMAQQGPTMTAPAPLAGQAIVTTTATAMPPAPPVTVTQTAVVPAPAVSAETQFAQSPAYKECTQLAATNPIAAEQKAVEWLKIDDGIGPHHCRAMAFYGQRRFAEAADELNLVRTKITPRNVALRSYVTRQASKAWLDAQRPDAAIAVLSSQITDMASVRGDNAEVSRLTAELLLARAKLRNSYGQFTDALQDLDHAVSLTPVDEEVLMERARTFAQLNDLPLAKQDVANVLKVNPSNPKALELQRLLDNPTGK